MRYYRRNERFAEHDFANVFLRIRRDLEKYGDVPLERARLLEVGCGQHFSATLLFHSSGADVVGIDTSVSAPKLTVRTFARMVRENGAERAAKTLVRRALFDRPYYRVLEREFNRPLRFDGLDLRTMSATDLSFPDGEFDYVFSNAVFEHIEDVDVAVREIARVLSPGGLAWIGVHLFPSMSGGHCLDWAYPEEMPSASVPPWDHLRDKVSEPRLSHPAPRGGLSRRLRTAPRSGGRHPAVRGKGVSDTRDSRAARRLQRRRPAEAGADPDRPEAKREDEWGRHCARNGRHGNDRNPVARRRRSRRVAATGRNHGGLLAL